MIRLVTQFDDTRTKATVATPTCSSCCCCCCCVASTLTTSSVTALNVRDIAKEYVKPSGTAMGYEVLGFLALPIAIVLAIGSGFVLSVFAIVVMIVAWVILLKFVYKKVGLSDSSKLIGATIGLGLFLFIVELIGGGILVANAVIDNRTGNLNGLWFYLLLALISPFVLVPLFRRLTHPMLASVQNSNTPILPPDPSAFNRVPQQPLAPTEVVQANKPQPSDSESQQLEK